MSSPKEQARNEIRRRRRELLPEEKKKMDQQIKKQLISLLLPEETKGIYLYASMEKEVDTWSLMERLWKKKVPLALPRVEDRELVFCLVDNRNDLKQSDKGIWEPRKSCVLADMPDAVVITPGLAFSAAGARLGYGGGYYDRFFQREAMHMRIALAYPFQMTEDLFSDVWDQKMHKIVMPEGIVDCCFNRRMGLEEKKHGFD